MVLKKPLIFLNFELKADTLQDTVKPLHSGHLRVLKNLSVIKKCPLFGGSLRMINTFANKHFSRYSVHVAISDVRYWEVSLHIFYCINN